MQRMANCRKSGDELEYWVCCSLIDIGIPLHPESVSKWSRLSRNFKSCDIDKHVIKDITQVLQKQLEQNESPINFVILTDDNGKKGDVADIRIELEQQKCIRISCKRNNTSIKHPRPTGIINHLFTSNPITCNIEKHHYKSVNNAQYQAIKEYSKFKDLPQDMKDTLYLKINEHILQILAKADRHALSVFTTFTLNLSYEHDVLTYNNGKITYKRYEGIGVALPEQVSITFHMKSNNTIIGCINNVPKFSMRLHTASSRITKTLSLKYDVQIIHDK